MDRLTDVDYISEKCDLILEKLSKTNNPSVKKKDSTKEAFDESKVKNAVLKSAKRTLVMLPPEEIEYICKEVHKRALNLSRQEVTVDQLHNIVESVLDTINEKVATSYRNYRNYKQDFIHMLDKVYQENQRIMYIGDKENSNIDSTLVSTKRSLVYNELSKQLYKKFFLTVDELQAINDGYIYIHDMSARLNTMNCCLFDVSSVLKGGFEMGNIWYNEPKTLDVAFDVIGDIVMAASAQQYGGFTLAEVDKILAPYASKSFELYKEEYLALGVSEMVATDAANKKVENDFKQGFQGWEYKFNTVASSRGDYPFITVTAGLGTDKYEKMATLAMLEVRKNGQGKKGNKKPVLFPKIVFLYDKELHGDGKPNYDLYKAGIECSKKAMYPDWLSLTGEGYISEMYKRYKRVISPMGCVQKDELVTYKYKGQLFVESIGRLWDRLAHDITPKLQENGQDLYIEALDLEIYDTKEGFVSVRYLNRNTQKNWVNVKISNGRYLTCTDDHPFHTQRGRILAKNLQLGDEVIIGSTQYCGDDNTISLEEAWILGFMLCDGCYQNHSVFASIAMDEEDIEQRFVQYMKSVFNEVISVKIQDRRKTNKGYYKDLRILSDGNGNLTKLINYFTNEFGGVNKMNRHIPNRIFNSSRSIRLAFLSGMIDADGFFNDNAKTKYPTLQLGSTNKELALQQMALIQSLGVGVKFYASRYGNGDRVRFVNEAFITEEIFNSIVCEKKRTKVKSPLIELSIFHECGKITDIQPFEQSQYSYDVTTTSDHFEVSGIYSHNCRAFLSPWYERGGMEPADENDKPVFVGRFNIGAVSLHLPMIYAKAKRESKDFYEVLDYYLEMIRELHLRTYDYLGEMRASINPLGFCEGGFYGGHLKPSDKIKPILEAMTASFGITALNELQELHNKQSLVEDGLFAIEVMQHINEKVDEFKEADKKLYAIYGTPAESLCFSGNTLVSTVSGYKPISEVKVGDLVYSYNETYKQIELKPVAASSKTNEHALVVKVTTDNGQEFICTPDHPFAVRRVQDLTIDSKFVSEYLEYIPAKELQVGMRLKSCYTHTDKNGRCYFNSSQCSNYRYRINALYKYGSIKDGFEIHHIDEDKSNDSLENLVMLPKSEHRRIHGNLVAHQYTSENCRGELNSFYGKHHTEESKMANRLAHLGKSIERFSLDFKHLEHFECADDAERMGYTRHSVVQCCKGTYKHGGDTKRRYKDSYWFYTEDCKELMETNHKVVSVEYLDELIPVYNIEVADNNNYFVGGDQAILVHNCGLQVEQFRKKYGIVENVSDRPYVSNSFHCHVSENISPIQKQDLEKRFWELSNGGKIQYVKYPIGYNEKAVDTLVRRAMDMGFYEGVNLSLAYCDDCGYEQLEMDVCPKCGSKNLTKIDRMNGYLSYSRVKGDTRLNDAKMAEIKDRISM